jgi:hypothetical protein
MRQPLAAVVVFSIEGVPTVGDAPGLLSLHHPSGRSVPSMENAATPGNSDRRSVMLTDSTPCVWYCAYDYWDLTIFRDHGPCAFGVYQYLNLHAQGTGIASRSIRQMAHDLNLSTATIQHAIKVLVDAGYITRELGGPNHPTNCYAITTPQQGSWSDEVLHDNA